MTAFLDIIILLVIVIMVFYKLRSLLGTRPENETEISKESAAKIFDILVKESQKHKQKVSNTVEGGELAVEDNPNLSPTEKALNQIPDFDRDRFINNAKKAFEIIIVAFSKGDVETLEPLLSKSLMKKFKETIEVRKVEEIKAETDFIGFDEAQILDVKINKTNLVKIMVKFVSEQVNILKNKKDEVIEGDENFIQSITDVWTFEKNLNNSSPIWLLSSTKK